MRKTLLFLTALLLAVGVQATITIDEGKKYYFVCKKWGVGSIVLGANHGSSAYVYYDTSNKLSDDSYWFLKKDGSGYTIQNASSREYLVYKDERIDGVAKGIQLSASVTGDDARWNFGEDGSGNIYIYNIGESGQYFNVRTDGTNLVGTYTRYSDENSLFNIYDEDRNSVLGGSGSGGGTETFDTDKGITSAGEFWELTGIDQPVVYTTDFSNPVLYHIHNLRTGMAADDVNYDLVQSNGSGTQFYFVNDGAGTVIYTASGNYVTTNFYAANESNYPLQLYYGVPNGNIWGFSFYKDPLYPGYNIEKLDNLPTTQTGWWGQSQYTCWNDYNLNSYHGIGLYKGNDSGSTFVFTSSDERHLMHLALYGITFEGHQATGFTTYVDSIRIDGKDLIYDSTDKVFYYPLPTTLRGGKDFTGKVEVKVRVQDADYSLCIDDQEIGEDGTFTLPAVDCANEYVLSLLKNGEEEVCRSKLYFTFLPVVEIKMPSCNGSYYTTGTIRVTDADTPGYDSTFVAAYKYRGATAQGYSKKSYAIKLRDENGSSVDREFFGLRDDNNWILDAMAVDYACMRNRVSTDLWNDFSTKPYHRREGWEKKARTGTRGRFVEVFLNGKYHGLYCMTEKMDRKQLKLKKYVAATPTTADTIHATLYKSTDWTYEVFMGHETGSEYFPKRAPASFNNSDRKETWRGYEIKYPDYEEEKIDWGPLWNAISFVATSSDAVFERDYETYFDAPVVDDYYLFLELMLATDNHGKNMFLFNYDQLSATHANMMGIAPWDLDGTWGRRWNGTSYYTTANQDFTTFLWNYEHGTHTLFHRLAESKQRGWKSALAERYAELRENYFNPENLMARFREYADLFAESHADTREQRRWSSYHRNIGDDVDFICDWIKERVAFLDEAYDYDPVVSGISRVTDSNMVSAAGGKGVIAIHAQRPVLVRIYSVGGALVRSVQVDDTLTEVGGFAPGVYIVGDQKVIVR